MNKFVLFIFALLLTGCGAKYPAIANLDLQISAQPTTIYTGSSAFIQGHDARENTEVVVYKFNDKPAVRVPNLSSPHILVTEHLADGLHEQGLIFENGSDTRILLDINELLVTVTRPKLLYTSEARSQITLKVIKGANTVTKKYSRETMHESGRRPDIKSLERMLNEQLSDIVNQILQDENIRAAITSK